MKPIITRISNLSILDNRIVQGSLISKVILPLAYGTIEVPNRSNIKINYNDQEYIIRLDKIDINYSKPKETHLELATELIKGVKENLNALVNRLYQTGVNLFKEITDCNDLQVALGLIASFEKQGVVLVSKKILVEEEAVMQYSVKCRMFNYNFETTKAEELLIFLGYVARSYTLSSGQNESVVTKVKEVEMPF